MGVQPVRQTAHKVRLRDGKGVAHLFFSCVFISIQQVLRDSSGKEPCLLWHIGDALSQFLLGHLTHIPAVYLHRALRHIVEAQEQLRKRGLSASCPSDNRRRLFLPADEIQTGKGIRIRIRKPEGHIAELHDRSVFRPAPMLPHLRVRDLRLPLQDLPDAPAADRRPGQEDDDHLRHDDIEEDEDGVFGERRDIANLHISRSHPVSADPEDGSDTEIDDKKRRTLKPRKKQIRPDGRLRILLKRLPQPLLLALLLPERTDHPHAGQIFPEHHIHPVQEALEPAEDFRRPSRHKYGEHDNEQGHPNQYISHHCINRKRHGDPHHARRRDREHHLDAPDHGLLDDVDVIEGPRYHGACSEPAEIILGKRQRFLIDRIAHILAQLCRQIRTEPAPCQGSGAGNESDRQHGCPSADNVVHLSIRHADINHIRRQLRHEKPARHVQDHDEDRKHAQPPVWFQKIKNHLHSCSSAFTSASQGAASSAPDTRPRASGTGAEIPLSHPVSSPGTPRSPPR